MKHIFAILSVCLVAVNCQTGRPPRPPPSAGPMGTPVPMPASMPTNNNAPARVSPPRPQGCSPGCGPTEICAELGVSYCRHGACSVCIKMSSIRFPASALASIFAQQPQPTPQIQPVQPVLPAVPAQTMPQMQPPASPLSTSHNATSENKTLNENENIYSSPSRQTKRPPRPPPLKGAQSALPEFSNNGPPIDKLDIQQAKYPLLVAVTDGTHAAGTASKDLNAQANVATASSSSQIQEESQLVHVDHDQMTKWYQQYQTFKEQQAKMNGQNATDPSSQSPDVFDYSSFENFQKWLVQNGQPTTSQDSSKAAHIPQISQTKTTMDGLPKSKQSIADKYIQPQTSVAGAVTEPQIKPLDFNSLQHQHSEWVQGQQKGTTSSVAKEKPVVLDPVALPTNPVGEMPSQSQNTLDLASVQQQFLEWQRQQRQQNQAVTASVQPSYSTMPASVPMPVTTDTFSQSPPQTIDFATLQNRFKKWQQEQTMRDKAQAHSVNVQNTHQNQQTSSQEILINAQQNPLLSQEQNTLNGGQQCQLLPRYFLNQSRDRWLIAVNCPDFVSISHVKQPNDGSYVPQQPVNTFNDPFGFDFQGPQQNPLMELMMFSSLGFGGGMFF